MTDGCVVSSACNYNPDANADDGSCLYLMNVECVVVTTALALVVLMKTH